MRQQTFSYSASSYSVGLPEAQGLYDPRHEKDSCGIGFVANVKNVKSHTIIDHGLTILKNLAHRGAVGADPQAGDGAGMLLQLPDRFLRAQAESLGFQLPPAGRYGLGMVYMPMDNNLHNRCQKQLEELIAAEGQDVLGWRDVPCDSSVLGETVKGKAPLIRQVVVAAGKDYSDQAAFERILYIIRKQAENWALNQGIGQDDFYIASLSSRTVVYKGMVLSADVGRYFLDLRDQRVESALSLVHQRFSTNTFPTWSLAQPFRLLCHNGEINTLRGNLNWMNARRASLTSQVLGSDINKVWPLIPEGLSDSACADHAFEFLLAGGYSLAHAMMLMIPEAWSDNDLMDPHRRAFYEHHAAFMEPWDGPAAIAFTDGRQIGATLDRNGLRPARYLVTDDDMVLMASEMGVLDVPADKIVKKWRLQPGKMLLIDLEEGRIIDDSEIKSRIVAEYPYREWLHANRIRLADIPPPKTQTAQHDPEALLKRQQAFGYSREDIAFFLEPMAQSGQEPTGSMGVDTPLSVLSDQPKTLYSYFKQCFAQVTNPAIDPIREELVMSLASLVGPRPNLFDLEGSQGHQHLEVPQPILTDDDLAKIRTIGTQNDGFFRARTLDITFAAATGCDGLKAALDRVLREAEEALANGNNILILSDRQMGPEHIAIPALLATAAVHHHLVAQGRRTRTGLVVETGEARELHHFAVLAGYGAEAINPYLAFETLRDLAVRRGDLSPEEARAHYIKACGKALLKIMSKMGISTYQSYCGAQIFDAVGLNSHFVNTYFPGTATTVEGIGLAEVAEESIRRHRLAYGRLAYGKNQNRSLDVGGEYAFRLRGESHVWNPHSIADLQHAVRGGLPEKYRQFADGVNIQNTQLLTLRGLMAFTPGDPVPLEAVESAENIVKRFVTGAMSFGSISREAHTTLAVAMNRIGGKSNTGEGGEEPERFQPLPNGDSMRSAIKQVASGRFGVTTEYLVNADDIQIKICQGAKPGEGGQLPGHKVDDVIAKVRYATPGVGLISPPPHHDIYSIEDLAQLIYDLKNVNPTARISVKLASEVGVGTVAAGVVKARADHITIAGYDGGTGASPLTSIRHAGSPWEIGLAETHQTLVLNNLRGRVSVQVDGGLRTGRDVVIGALLGADEFGFSSAPLIAAGCIMMRKCHLNTCPVGVATQNPELRKRFTGTPEHVINYFFFVAEEARSLMAELGFTTIDAMIGQMDRLNTRDAVDHWKAKGLDFGRLLKKPAVPDHVAIRNRERQIHDIETVLDRRLIKQARPALDHGKPVHIETTIGNHDRTTGAMLSGEIAKRYGFKGLPDDCIVIRAQGTAGQSFGAFLTKGVTMELIGEANDYVGKGLSGGRLVVYPPARSPFKAEENIIVGNTVLYGAIAGECYFRGVAGERFAVRNSGAVAVIEGVGDHCCEYMTGGVVVCLGPTGRNFAAGMSGGIAYILDADGQFERRCNPGMVDIEPVGLTEDEKAPLNSRLNKTAHNGDLGRSDLGTLMGNLLHQDEARLRHLLQRHLHYTNSDQAGRLLENWPQTASQFIKVTPRDYRRALSQKDPVVAAKMAAPALQ